MMIKCKECDLPISDKAVICPHCGCPLTEVSPKKQPKKKKRMRLPNGFGSIAELKSGNRRNRFLVRVPVGKTPTGKVIQKPLKPQSCFKTYNEAYLALTEYNKNPYDLDEDVRIGELYEKWTEQYFKDTSSSSHRTITAAWAYCSSIYDMRAKDLRARHIKGCMEEGYRIGTTGKNKGKKLYASASTKSRIKSIFNLMLDYALECEIVDRNYARTFNLSDDVVKEANKAKIPHINFTDEEMDTLWANLGKVKFVDWVLIQCYMGWRPQELATLRLDEINIEKWYMCAGIKTDAGKQRIVPIHTKIRDLVVRNIEFANKIGSEYLLNDKGQTHAGSWKITYDKYKYRFEFVRDTLHLNPGHRPHDPRMTFVTNAKKVGMDEYAVKEMVGHSIKDITESVYTVRDLEWLRNDLEKLE